MGSCPDTNIDPGNLSWKLTSNGTIVVVNSAGLGLVLSNKVR